VCGL
jgi:hypothetical protein